MVTRKTALAGMTLAALMGGGLIQPGTAKAVNYGGIEFVDGAVSFADVVLDNDQNFNGGPAASAVNFMNPTAALGTPDFVYDNKTGGNGAYSLGGGGKLTLGFTDNLLTNSGSVADDLWIFEIGNMVEDTYIYVRPTLATLSILNLSGYSTDGEGFLSIGQIGGGTRGLDIDTFLTGFDPGVLAFNAVRLIDARSLNGVPVGTLTGSALLYAGAEIDAVGAIFTLPNPGGPNDEPDNPGGPADPEPTPEPATAALGILGLGALTLKLGRRTRNA